MKKRTRTLFACIGLALMLSATLASAQTRIFKHPQPGDVYKEYIRLMDYDKEMRVTWPDSPVDRAQAELPNAVLDLNIDDLNGATRAELVIDFWGGHAGTIGKKIRFNGHDWLDVPDLTTVSGSPECYTTMRNVTINIPLSHLASGTNYFEGTNSGQSCNNFEWGLWGWYGVILRVYYSPSKPHTTGQISSVSSGGTLSENPVVTASVSGTATRVDFLAYYNGYDEDGDGFYQDYHESYHTMKYEYALPIRYNLGSATSAPWQSTWNTDWVPDQEPGSVKLLARICDANGYWYVTPEVDNLTLHRSGKSVKMYQPTDVPTEWQTRASNLMTCHIPIPADHDLSKATAVQFHMRTWNGLDGGELDPSDYYWTKINDWTTPQYGVLYFYSYDILDVPVSAITNGSNTISYFATSMGHGIELLWPGPSLLVKYSTEIVGSVPGTPVLASPADGAGSQPTSMVLKWRPPTGATSYCLQVATSGAFTSGIVTNDSTLTDTTATVSSLANNTLYYWRVAAANDAGMSNFATPRSFTTTIGAPGAATLLAPANSAANLGVTGIVCRWNVIPTAAQYRLQVATDSTFGSGLVRNDSTLTDTLAALDALVNGSTYFWRVAGRNTDGNGPYSTVWRFSTIVAVPGAASLVSPADNAAGVADSMKFIWRPTVPAASKYWFEIARDSVFTLSRVVDSTLADTAKTIRGLTSATKYYWRVRGGNVAGWGAFSGTRRFTPTFTSVDATEGLPVGIVLKQNYPNPFNPTTQIEFGLPKEMRAKVEVFDVRGSLVMTLCDGLLSAGYHRVTVNAGQLPSGVYLYRLTTPESTVARKMLLVR
jgi:hypothetical protein